MNDFAEAEFNTKPKVAWMIDRFEHPGIMPRIAREVGLKYYVFLRGMNKPDSPQEFFWTGTDGRRGLTPVQKHPALKLSRLENTGSRYQSFPSGRKYSFKISGVACLATVM